MELRESVRPVVDEREEPKRWGFCVTKRIPREGDVYLKRFIILKTPWFAVFFHRIYRPDNQRDLHDHPWNFFSLVLRGWYRELTPQGVKTRKWFNFKRAEDRHAISEVSRSPIWTLVFTGRYRRDWGFWVKSYEFCPVCGNNHEVSRFVPHGKYENLERA